MLEQKPQLTRWGVFSSSEDQKGDRLKALLMSQLEVMSRELGQLKGA